MQLIALINIRCWSIHQSFNKNQQKAAVVHVIRFAAEQHTILQVAGTVVHLRLHCQRALLVYRVELLPSNWDSNLQFFFYKSWGGKMKSKGRWNATFHFFFNVQNHHLQLTYIHQEFDKLLILPFFLWCPHYRKASSLNLTHFYRLSIYFIIYIYIYVIYVNVYHLSDFSPELSVCFLQAFPRNRSHTIRLSQVHPMFVFFFFFFFSDRPCNEQKLSASA